MANSYDLTLSDGTHLVTINETTIATVGGITFTGRRRVDYGEHRNSNLIRIVENFAHNEVSANTPDPQVITAPFVGQTWYNKSTPEVLVYDGTDWVSILKDDYLIAAAETVASNQVALDRYIDGVLTTDDVILTNIAAENDLIAHFTSSIAHTAIEITYSGTIPGADLQTAIENTYQALTDHIVDNTAHAASNISFTPYLTIGSTNTQSALQELENEIDSLQSAVNSAQTAVSNHLSDNTAHTATEITTTPNANVQARIEALDGTFTAGVGNSVEEYGRIIPGTATSVSVSGTYQQLPFDTVDVGNSLGQYDTGTGVYTAAFNQEVVFRVFTMIEEDGTFQIRVNGTPIREYRFRNMDSPSDAEVSGEATVRTRINSGDQVTAVIRTDFPTRTATVNSSTSGFEFEVYRAL